MIAVVVRSTAFACFISVGFVAVTIDSGLASAAIVLQVAVPSYVACQSRDSADILPSALKGMQPAISAAETPAESETDAMDKAKVNEIMAVQDDERKVRKFLELVVLPLGICLALVMLLRRGFLN